MLERHIIFMGWNAIARTTIMCLRQGEISRPTRALQHSDVYKACEELGPFHFTGNGAPPR